ncbi:MAG: hypothetical protein IIZ06_02005 [Kiritimatiellae bacterium]|nr:hypothetical protein [Kiritimatiellia bacterium]
MKKVRTDAWGEDLPEETRRQLYALTKPPTEAEKKAGRPWLRGFHDDVRPYLSEQGIVEPSPAGWYRFLQRMRIAEAEQARFSVEGAKRIAEGVVAAHVDAKLAADYLTAKALDASTDPRPEAQQSAAILAAAAAKFHSAAVATEKLKLDAARQRTADEQLRLAREKFEAAEKRLAAVQGAVDAPQLTDAERVAKIKGIFGMK